MHLLYDSDSYAVMQIQANAESADANASPAPKQPQLARNGFEIVDKRSGKEVYLDGSWAELFQQRLDGWQQKTPTEEEIEDILESYAELAQMPVVMH
ncbi:MAG: hypothetical protein RLZZ03_1120 [Pseudomonadota bacterium]|jgi:hypothetical protein